MSELEEMAKQALQACTQHQIMLATAESCTGGMIASMLTDIEGCSAIFDRGFVTYSNEAKIDMLGVSEKTLKDQGAVSRETVIEMAAGALERSQAGIAVAVTGLAGPSGGSQEKPIGLVWFGLVRDGADPVAEKHIFENRGRDYIRRETVKNALHMIRKALEAAA
jgi:nicotinamide-nucleotide amidase